MQRLWPALVAVVAMTCGLVATAEEAAPPPQPQSPPTFAWPDGLVLDVTFSVDGKRIRGGTTESTRSSSGFQWTVAVDDEGRRTVRRDALPKAPSQIVELPVDANGERVPYFKEVQELIDDLGSYVPAFVVDRNGTFVRAEGLEKTIERRDLILDRAAAPAPLRAQLASLLSEEAAELRVADEWKMMVESWLAFDWSAGSEFEQERIGRVNETQPPVTLIVTFRHLGSVPCGAGDEAESCIALEAISEPDPEDVELLLRRTRVHDVTDLQDFTLENRIYVEAHPETMVPTKFEVYRLYVADYGPEAPDNVFTHDERRRTWRFVEAGE